MMGQTEIVDILLANGADVKSKDKNDETALMAAAFSGRADIVKRLIASGADVCITQRTL